MGSGCSSTPNSDCTRSCTNDASCTISAAVAPPRLVIASVCLVEMPGARARQGEPAADARLLDQPGRAQFDVERAGGELRNVLRMHAAAGDPEHAIGFGRVHGPARRRRRQRPGEVLGDDRVGEERPGADRVLVLRIQHHPLGCAQREHRAPQPPRPETRAPSGDAERIRELGVGDGSAQRRAESAGRLPSSSSRSTESTTPRIPRLSTEVR